MKSPRLPDAAEDNANTPLTPAERDGLIPAYITFRHELNEAEATNIATARSKFFRATRRPTPSALLDERFVKRLHKAMFGEVWDWAGRYRRTERNLGSPWHSIPTEMRGCLDRARTWIDLRSFDADEIAVRLHHGLVFIHPFPNGNGRWSRLTADLVMSSLNQPALTWGSSGLTSPGDLRSRYIAALREADRHDFRPLLTFARS